MAIPPKPFTNQFAAPCFARQTYVAIFASGVLGDREVPALVDSDSVDWVSTKAVNVSAP